MKLNGHNLFLTVGGLGFTPKMPGTIGTLAALLIFILPDDLIPLVSIILVIFLTIISLPLIERAEAENGQDPSFIVIDEVIGFLVITSFPFIQWRLLYVIMAFVLFRLFDIIKPYPINLINNRKGAIWVILDDVVAGLFSLIVLYLLIIFLRNMSFFAQIL